MVQLTNATEIETVVATQNMQPTEPIQPVEPTNSIEVLEIVNLLEVIKDSNQFSYYLKIIANDVSLSPTAKEFLTIVANIGIERGTSEIVTDDIEIAAKFNRNPRTVRRWITRSIALGKISRHIMDYGTGKYCIRFLYNFLTNLSENQRLTVKVNIPICPTKPTNTRTRKPKAKANNENTIIDQINNQNITSILEIPSSTPTAATLHLALTAPGEVDNITQNLTPLVQSLIGSSTPLPTDKMLEQLSQAENKIEPSSLASNNQVNVTAINSIKPTKPISSPISSSVPSNKSFVGVARTATFGNLLVAQKEASLLQQQLEQAEELFSELTEEQQDLVLGINDLIYEHWERTNKLVELESKWKRSRTNMSFDGFLDQALVNQSKLLYRRQYVNFVTINTKENARELAVSSLLEKWEAMMSQPANEPTTSQNNVNPDTIIKPSIQDIISTTPEIITDSLDSFNQTQFDQTLTLDTPTLTINEPSSGNIINQNVVIDTLTTQSTLDTFNQSDVSQNNQNSASQSLDIIDQTTANNHLIDLNPEKPSQQPTLDNSDQTTNQISQPSLDTFNQNPLPDSKNDLVNTVQSATNADNKSSDGSQNVAKDSASPNSLKGDCFGQHCPTLNDTLPITSATPNILSNTNAGTDNNTSFKAISSLLPSTYSTDIPTSTISTSGDNMSSATTVPNSSNNTTPFKALKLSSFLEDHDLDLKEKEEKKSFKAFLPVSGTNTVGSTEASTSTSTTPTTSTNPIQNHVTDNSTDTSTKSSNPKILSDLNQVNNIFNYIPTEIITITRGDKNCLYCKGDGKLYRTLTAIVSTSKGQKTESFRDQNFIPCTCAKLYDMMEYALGRGIALGTPNLTEEQLTSRKELMAEIDEHLAIKAKVNNDKSIINQQVNSSSTKQQLTNQAEKQAQVKPQPRTKSTTKSLQNLAKPANKVVNEANPVNKSSQASPDKGNDGKELKNYAIEKLALSPTTLAMIQYLNSTAHTRLDDKGKPDLVILTTNDKKYCIPPNPYDQFRKSEFSFLEWLLYSVREPNRVLPVRMACQRYYLGKKDAEMIKWKQERAELGVGGFISNYEDNQDGGYNNNNNDNKDLKSDLDNDTIC